MLMHSVDPVFSTAEQLETLQGCYYKPQKECH